MTNFSFKNAKAIVAPVPPKLIIYGRNGIGKSRFAAAAPSPIFLDLDKNINEISCISNIKGLEKEFPFHNFQNILDFLTLLITEEHQFKSIVIDSLTSLDRYIEAQVKKERNVTGIGDLKYGLGYELMASLWAQVLDKLNQLWSHRKMIVILIGHEKAKEKEQAFSESYDQYHLSLPTKSAELLKNWVNNILYASDRSNFLEKKGDFGATQKIFKSADRVLYTDDGTVTLAKNTYNLPLTIPFNKGEAAQAWNIFYSHVQDYYKNQPQEQIAKGEK